MVEQPLGHAPQRRLRRRRHEGRQTRQGVAVGLPVERVLYGALQALGQALFEGLVYDGDEPANGTPWSYRAPFMTDLPERFTSHLEEHGMGPGPFGAKGIGEAPVLGIAAAVANAVEDAVGVRITALPITPEKILRALRERDAAGKHPQGHHTGISTLHHNEVQK